ncbi:hypothetical protein KI387_019564, partial [Taxus chinensis]
IIDKFVITDLQGVAAMHRIITVAVVFAFLLIATKSSANVILIGINFTLSYKDREANFASFLKQSGVCGTVQVTEPFDACLPLINTPKLGEGTNTQFALIKRGKCSFESKVRNAQAAGFRAVIIYNNKDGNRLIEKSAMPGFFRGTNAWYAALLAVLISKHSIPGLAALGTATQQMISIIKTNSTCSKKVVADRDLGSINYPSFFVVFANSSSTQVLKYRTVTNVGNGTYVYKVGINSLSGVRIVEPKSGGQVISYIFLPKHSCGIIRMKVAGIPPLLAQNSP